MSYVYRAARMVDTVPIVGILEERQGDSRYAGIAKVDSDYARKTIAGMIQRNGGTTEGGAFVHVAVKDGKIEAFIAASLVRIYAIFDKLGSCDHFLIGRRSVPASALVRLFDAYLGWARSNPKVIEVGASCSDVIAGGERFGPIYERRGFLPTATTYRMSGACNV